MKVYSGISDLDDGLRGAVLTVGNFDGVHLGHQRILRTARALATVSRAKVVAMTFEPHPLAILTPDRAPARLTPWEEKARLLESAGADAIIRLESDKSLLGMPAEDFVREILVSRIHPSYIVEGPNFGFGRGRKGNVELLRALSPKGGFQVRLVDSYRLHVEAGDHVIVSSTVVRELLQSGGVEDAAQCLGRPFGLVGEIVSGDAAGRHLGFPTINLRVGDQIMPAEGVYAGTAEIAGWRARAAISIGRRPTLSGQSLVIEAFVLDRSGDWYGEAARLELVSRVRDQVRFDSREALADQIARDVEAVRETEMEL